MSDPLAFFLTWTTYGSWLPGDERGWTEKPGRMREPDPTRQATARSKMTEDELTLNVEQREIVERTIADHCRIRGWQLHAVACRTQHVHVVVTALSRNPEEVMDQFKAWCTRRLKEHESMKPKEPAKNGESPAWKPEAPANEIKEGAFAGVSGLGCAKIRQNWWTQRGSKRQLFDEDSLAAAVQYVLEGQDGGER